MTEKNRVKEAILSEDEPKIHTVKEEFEFLSEKKITDQLIEENARAKSAMAEELIEMGLRATTIERMLHLRVRRNRSRKITGEAL